MEICPFKQQAAFTAVHNLPGTTDVESNSPTIGFDTYFIGISN